MLRPLKRPNFPRTRRSYAKARQSGGGRHRAPQSRMRDARARSGAGDFSRGVVYCSLYRTVRVHPGPCTCLFRPTSRASASPASGFSSVIARYLASLQTLRVATFRRFVFRPIARCADLETNLHPVDEPPACRTVSAAQVLLARFCACHDSLTNAQPAGPRASPHHSAPPGRDARASRYPCHSRVLRAACAALPLLRALP